MGILYKYESSSKQRIEYLNVVGWLIYNVCLNACVIDQKKLCIDAISSVISHIEYVSYYTSQDML